MGQHHLSRCHSARGCPRGAVLVKHVADGRGVFIPLFAVAPVLVGGRGKPVDAVASGEHELDDAADGAPLAGSVITCKSRLEACVEEVLNTKGGVIQEAREGENLYHLPGACRGLA